MVTEAHKIQYPTHLGGVRAPIEIQHGERHYAQRTDKRTAQNCPDPQ